MDGLASGAQNLPDPELVLGNDADPALPPAVDAQLHDQPQQAQNLRRSPGTLTIPATSVYIPATPCSCAQSACEVSPFPTPMQQDSGHGLLRARNIVVFGESGVGKSSVINMIAGRNITQTSNDAVGCTFQYQCHQVLLDGLSMNLWDTVGLDEGTEGTVPAKQAEGSLKAFLRQITRRDGIDLLLYCVRGTRVRQALLRNYNIFYAAICRKKVPVALVVTGLENYGGEMETWWTEHEKDLAKHGMRFDAHACVTTMRSDHPAIQSRLKQSRDILRDLVRAKFDTVTWKADEDSLISASLPDVRALLRATEKTTAPLITICDTPGQINRVHLFRNTTESQTAHISGRKYQCLYVNDQQVSLGDSRLCGESVQRPDLLIFCANMASEPDQTWTTLKQFHKSFGGETCPVIIVLMGLDNHEAAVKVWRIWSSSHSGEIIASPTYYPDPGNSGETVERAEKALATLIEEKCLNKFGENLTKFQKFCRHGRLFFARRM